MKYVLLTVTFLSSTYFSGIAAAAPKSKDINCKTPENLVGSFAKLEGHLKFSKLDPAQNAGPYEATGNLTLIVSKNKKIKIDVRGQYDDVEGFHYAHLGNLDEKSSYQTIYLNFKDSKKSAESYIEYGPNETTIKLQCGG
jgi:hypothetical protein